MSQVAATAPVADDETEAEPGRPRWIPKRPGLLAFGAYVVLAVIFFWPGLLPGHTVSAADYLWSAAPWNTSIPTSVPVQTLHPLVVGSNPHLVDGVTVFEPFLQYTRSQLPHIPLWDPYIMGGTPYLADMQSAIFSPFSLPAYVLPFWWSLGVIAVMKVVVAATGTYLLARALKMGQAGAFMAGLVFGFGFFLIAWIPWPLDNVFALIPWILLATERLVRRPGVLPAAGLASLVALQFFGGHPESSVYAIFAVVGYFALRLLQGAGGGVVDTVREARRRGGSLWRALAGCVPRPVLAFVLALVVGTALAAIALIPFLELLHNSSDLTARPRSQVHVQVKYAFAAFLPRYFPGSFEIETAFYAGALPLMLAVAALLRPRLERVAFAVVGGVSVLVVLGIQPLFALAGHTPGLDETYLSRLTIIYLLCVALLAGWGLDDLVRRRPSRRVAATIGVVAVLLALLPLLVVAATRGTSLHYLHRALDIAWLFASAPLLHAPHVAPIDRLTALVVWLTVAGFAVLLLLLRLTRVLGARVFALLAIALVVGDLFQAGMGYNPAITQSDATQPVTGAITYLQHINPARYVGVTPYNTVVPLPPDVNVRYGLTDLRGYDLPVISRFATFWAHYVAPATPLLPEDTPTVPLTVYNTLPPSTMRVLSLFGVRDILEQKHEPPPNIPGIAVAYDGPDANIYSNPGALPRTWLVDAQEVLPNPRAQLDRIGAASFHPLRAVVTGGRLSGLATGSASGPDPGTAHITSYGAERVAITAHATRPGELVLSDTWYPGWQATVNGRPATVNEVDYLLRGVAVPAGTDHIVFTYDPASFRHGWELSLAAAVVLAATVGVSLFRRRRRGGRTEGRHQRSEPGTGRGPTPAELSSA
jgi:hypothetical protein